MRNVSYTESAEICASFLAFFTCQFCYRCGRHGKAMQGDHGRNAPQMGKQHGGHSEVTEKCNGLFISLFYPVVASFPHVPVFCQKMIQPGSYPVIHHFHIAVGGNNRISPSFPLKKFGMFCPEFRKHVPDNPLLIDRSTFFVSDSFLHKSIRVCLDQLLRTVDIKFRRKFPKPFQHFCFFSKFIQCVCRSILCPSKR